MLNVSIAVSLGSCVNPGEPENGSVMQLMQPPDYYFGSILTFSCDENFTLVGSPSIQCVVGSAPTDVMWNDSVPTCQGKPSAKFECAFQREY